MGWEGVRGVPDIICQRAIGPGVGSIVAVTADDRPLESSIAKCLDDRLCLKGRLGSEINGVGIQEVSGDLWICPSDKRHCADDLPPVMTECLEEVDVEEFGVGLGVVVEEGDLLGSTGFRKPLGRHRSLGIVTEAGEEDTGAGLCREAGGGRSRGHKDFFSRASRMPRSFCQVCIAESEESIDGWILGHSIADILPGNVGRGRSGEDDQGNLFPTDAAGGIDLADGGLCTLQRWNS